MNDIVILLVKKMELGLNSTIPKLAHERRIVQDNIRRPPIPFLSNLKLLNTPPNAQD